MVRVRLGSGKRLGLVSGLALMSPVLIDCLTYEKPEKKQTILHGKHWVPQSC